MPLNLESLWYWYLPETIHRLNSSSVGHIVIIITPAHGSRIALTRRYPSGRDPRGITMFEAAFHLES